MAQQTSINTDKASLSIGSEGNVLPGAGVSVSINLSDVLLDCHASGIAFKLVCTRGYVKCASKIFEPLSMQLGSLDIQVQNGKWYAAQ
jgi:hypothetical protein